MNLKSKTSLNCYERVAHIYWGDILKEFESTNILEEIVKEVDCDIDPQLCQDNMERLLGGLGLEPASNQHNEEEHGIDPHLCSASEEDVHQVPPGTSHLHQEHTAKSEDSQKRLKFREFSNSFKIFSKEYGPLPP